MSLLASSSLVAASLMAGAGGVAVTLAPSVALAANECGDPSANAGAPDAFACTGVYATGINYTTTTDGDLALILVDSTVTMTGGVQITGNAGENISVTSINAIANAGDANINNNAGRGINLVASGGGSATVDIQDTDAGDGTPTISGTADGIRVRVTGGGDALVLVDSGTVTGGNLWGITAQALGGGDADVDYGSATVSGAGGIRAQSTTGGSSVVGTGDVNSTTTEAGIWAGGQVGGTTVNVSGTVTSGGVGVHAQTQNGGTANVTVGNITSTDVALEVQALNGGDANILGTGNLQGSTGIVAHVDTNSLGDINVTTGGTVTGTTGQGILAEGSRGDVTINSTAGLVTGATNGVAVTTSDGDGLITVGDVNAGNYGIVATATGTGDMSVTVTGAVVAGNTFDFDGIDIDTESGSASVNLLAGSSVTTNGATAVGIDIDTWDGGSISATIDGDILNGGLNASVNSGAGTVDIIGAGAINGGSYEAIRAASVDGALTVNVSGPLTGAAGVHTDVFGSGATNVTVGAITVTGTGVDVSGGTGTTTVTTNGVISAGANGVSVLGGGDVAVNINANVLATSTGVSATSTLGASTIVVASGVTIDPDDYGITNVAATDSTVITGDSVTVLVDNSDADAIAIGVNAISTAAADTAVGNPSVEVSLGTNNAIDLRANGFEADGGAGIWAQNTGGGTGSVSVTTGDNLDLQLQGDNAVGVFAGSTAGNVDIDIGAGRVWVYSGDGADSASNFTQTAAIYASSGTGNINIESDANVQAASNGAILGHGILAVTSGAGTVDITTGAASYTWGSDYGIGVYAGDGDTTIETNGMVQSDDLEGIFVNSGAGDISVTNNSSVTSGGAAAIELDAFGGNITVVSNGGVQGVGGIDADASGGGGFVDVTVASGVTVNGTTSFGMVATTDTGNINIDVDGTVTATANGVWAVTNDGDIDFDVLGSVSGGNGLVAVANGTGAIDIFAGIGSSVTGTAGAGISAVSDSGSVDVDVWDTVSGTTQGISVVSNTGNADVTYGPGSVSGGTGAGIDVLTGGTITITGFDPGAVSGTSGIVADGGGVVNVTTGTGTITATAGDGINATSLASTTVINNGAINATGGAGIIATSANSVSVTNNAAIAGTATAGIQASANGASGGIFVNNNGDIGSAADGVSGVGILGELTNAAATGNVNVSTDNSVYADTVGIQATNAGTGTVNVDVDTLVTVEGTTGAGIFAAITNAGSTSALTVGVDDGSTVIGGQGGIVAVNFGTGASTVTLGDDVTVDPDDVGILLLGAGEQTLVAGDGLSVTVANTDGDTIAAGISAFSGLAADVAAGDPAVEITIGEDLNVLVDDGAGGEADGAVGVLAFTGGTASSAITIGDGLAISVTGDSSVGVGAISDDGDISIDLGTGLIEVNPGDGTDSAGNFPGSAGIGAISDGGSITIVSDADLTVANGPGLDASAIHASTSDAGTVTITSNGVIDSSDVGINAETVDGLITIEQNGAVTATNVGVQAEATGTGAIDITSTASITTLGGDGIWASTDTGAIDIVTTAGTTITSGDDSISAQILDGAATADINIENNAALVPSGGGYGVYAWNYGLGDTNVDNTATGTIAGSAVYGIVAGANTGEVDIDNAGAIGSSADPVGQDGIYGYVAGGAGNVSITNLATGVIWASDQGIFGYAGGTGGVGVSNAAAIGGSANDGIHAESVGGGVTVINGGAIGSAVDQVADSGIEAIVGGGTSGILVQNLTGIWAAGTGIIADNNGTGQIIVTNSGGLTTGAIGIFTDASGGSTQVTNTGVINALNDGIQSNATGAGGITIDNDAAITAGNDGIEANATGTGAILVDNSAAISASSDGIRALANGGNVTVTSSAAVSATFDGIQTGTTGTGVTTINLNAGSSVASSTGGTTAGVYAVTTGTGLIDINVANGVSVASTLGAGIRTSANGGTVTLDLGTGGVGAGATTIRGAGANANSWVLDLNNAAGGTTTVNIASNTTVRSNDNTVTGYDDGAIRGVGGSVVVNNAGRVQGRLDFSGLTGNAVFNNTSSTSWHTTGASVFSGGADVLNNTATGVIFTNANGVATSWDFGAGADTFTNAGILVVGEAPQGAATLTITNLEAWNNSGSIFFGSAGTTASDGVTNDKIDLAGGTFTGSGNSRLFMDANLGALTQTVCTPTAADCFDATGASTAGSTTIRINDTSGVAFGAYNPTGIVLVDVTGAGTTAANHFSLLAGQPLWRADPNSSDGVLDKGLFFYDLTLNGKQHLLVGLPDSEAFEFTTVGQAAQSAWYATTGTWFDRQADLRQQLGDSEPGAGVWMKITGGQASRDLESSYDLFGVTYSFDTSYDQTTVGLVGGIDFVGASTADSSWLIGGMIGYVDSDVDFDASGTQASLEGVTYGLYGTYLTKNWFVDGVLAFNNLDLDYQAPTLAPAPNNIYASEVNSWGLQVEGGYSIPLGTSSFIEPLASLSYVSTEIDDIDVPGAAIIYDDQTSLRGAIGARVGTNVSRDTFDAQFSLTGKIWNEFEGENGLTIDTAGPDLDLIDDFNGTFGEVSGSINLFSNKSAFSAFVNAGVKFKDDYQSTDATLGFRWRW